MWILIVPKDPIYLKVKFGLIENNVEEERPTGEARP